VTSPLVVVAACYGASAVALGAFAAHGLSGRLPADLLTSFETGVRYQLLHAVLLLALAAWGRMYPSPWLVWSGRLIAVGVALFSGSIYLLSTRTLTGWEGARMLGPVTPLGGLLMIFGWLALLGWALRGSRAA
jgi:uncharacterized membrane protein YgdD (TMEM256/DUF423 family)